METANILQSLKEPSETGDPTVQNSSDFEKVRDKIFKFGKGKRNAKTKEVKESPAETAAASTEILNKLFQDENWEEIAALYFNARFTMTGYEGFLLDEKQKKILGSTLSTSMRLLIAIDPKWIALLVFGVNYTTIIAKKEVDYKAHKVVEEKEKR